MTGLLMVRATPSKPALPGPERRQVQPGLWLRADQQHLMHGWPLSAVARLTAASAVSERIRV